MRLRSLVTLFLFVAISLNISAQHEDVEKYYTPYILNYLPAGSPAWMAQLANPQGLNYFAMLDSFTVYLRNNPDARKKTPQTKQVVNHFRRFQDAYVNFVDKEGIIRLPKVEQYRKEITDINRVVSRDNLLKTTSKEILTGDKWKVISPFVTYDLETKKVSPAQTNIQRLAASRSNPNILYCGSETGLIFKTTDKGENWYPCNGGEWLSGEITAVDISHSDPDKVVVGAGGAFWKSTDGGVIWNNITPDSYNYSRSNVIQFKPNDDNIILAGTRTNLYRSTDGGDSWNLVLTGMAFDVKFSLQNPEICYAAVKQNSTVLFYKSTDAGASWNQLIVTDKPLISARIGLSEAPTGADYVYIWACRIDSYTQYDELYLSGSPLIFKSTDAGGSFIEYDPVSQMESADKHGGQGYYDMVCVASATDPETVLFGIIQLYRSTDGGKTIENIGGYYGNPQKANFDLHCDQQSIQTNGAGDTWLSTDGGIIYSNDFFEWHAEGRFNGIYASEMWGFDQGWNEDVMVGGRNHNGNMSQIDQYNGVTISMRGSERATGYVFLSNPRKVFYSDGSGAVILPDDWNENFETLYEFWIYPKESTQHGIGFEFDPRYAGCFYVVKSSSFWEEEYKVLWRTTNDGLSFSEVYTFDEPISSVAVSRSNPDKIVVGTRGCIYYSTDMGNTFKKYELPEDMTYTVNYKIAIHPKNEDEIWVTDNNPGGMWVTKDNGVTWNKYDDGLTFASWDNSIATHQVGRFFLTGNEKNAVYAVAFTMGYLNERYTTPRGRLLYRDDTTNGWIDLHEGLPKVMVLNRLLPFYKEGVVRLATNNGIWERDLVDKNFKPIAQPLLLNVGSGDNTSSTYPQEIQLESYSIVNQTDAEWKWDIYPEPLYISSKTERNPIMRIEPDQTYDISLTVTTPEGTDSKTIKSMIKGSKPVPEGSGTEEEDIVSRDLKLVSGNSVVKGNEFIFQLCNIDKIKIEVYAPSGKMVAAQTGSSTINIPTTSFSSGVYYYMAIDNNGCKYTGKLIVKNS